MREIAAITFTEAAASELRARVREAFERIVHDAATTPTTGAARSEAALVDLDGAAIGTVHSFAQRILAEHPVEAGLPPHVEVLDEVESLLAFGRRWEAHVDRMFADERLDEVIGIASRLGIRIDDRKFASLRDLAVVFSDNWDRVDRVGERRAWICRRSTAARRRRPSPRSPRCSSSAAASRTTAWPALARPGVRARPPGRTRWPTRRTATLAGIDPDRLEARPRAAPGRHRPGAARTGRRRRATLAAAVGEAVSELRDA